MVLSFSALLYRELYSVNSLNGDMIAALGLDGSVHAVVFIHPGAPSAEPNNTVEVNRPIRQK